MKSALVALDPLSKKGQAFDQFSKIFQQFQSKGFFSQTNIASVIHASLYNMPMQWYREGMKDVMAKEALERIKQNAEDNFRYESAKILHSDSHDTQDLVTKLSRYGQRQKSDVMVFASNDRSGLPHWLLGSFSETASLTAKIPTLVIKPHISNTDFSREVRFVIGIDTAAPLSSVESNWLAKAAKIADAHIDLVYVTPKSRVLLDSLQQRKNKTEAWAILEKIQSVLRKHGVRSKITILVEGDSIAHTIVEFAEKRKAWMTITNTPKRSFTRKLLLGSSARKILYLTKRPFLSLRLGL